MYLLVMGSIVFVWQQFLALLIGGAFHKPLAGTQPWVWTGVIIFLAVPALLQAFSMLQMTFNTIVKVLYIAVNARKSKILDDVEISGRHNMFERATVGGYKSKHSLRHTFTQPRVRKWQSVSRRDDIWRN
jgi:hypothetical protein